MRFLPLVLPLLALAPLAANATTYTVGPTGRQFTQLSTALANLDLKAGDVILVDGGATYSGGVVVGSNDSGTAANPVVIRWNPGTGSSRPRLQGGQHTIKFQQSNHVVLQGFDIRGGSLTCVFNEAHNVTVRDSIVRDCPGHGILGADQNSGSFTLEYSEVFNAGAGSNRHALYMQSDEVRYPGSTFLMRYNYVHGGLGGNLLKSRHERSLVYYNWFEGAAYQALELIGPDCETQRPQWTADLKREDADVVGNVIVHTSSWRNAVRIGGDLNGRSQGRVRMVNNTIVFDRAGAATAVMVQLGAGSLEMHNNAIHQPGGAPAIVTENRDSSMPTPVCGPLARDPWSGGRKVAGSHNWVQSSATSVPTEWNNTRRGSTPGLAGIAQRNLRPLATSPLLRAGTSVPASPSAFPFPRPLLVPGYDPAQRRKMPMGGRHGRVWPGGSIAIGALEERDIDAVISATSGME
jgi:hypothetical protein